MKSFLQSVRGEFAGWRPWEVWYLSLCTAAIAVISFSLGDTWLGIASAVTGTLYTMLAGKGKISCYFFGIFNVVSYGYIAYGQKLYGDAMLNVCWYLPMMLVGIFCWKNQRDDQECVIKNRLDRMGTIMLVTDSAAGIAVYAFLLEELGGSQPVTDAVTTVLSVAAMILTVKRCVEQWLLWTTVNAVSVFMWLRVYLAQGNSVAVLLWWLIMLITGIIFFIRWTMDIRRNQSISRKSGASVRQ